MYNPDDPWAWVAKAENDLLNIRNNLGCERIPWDTICFHAQQAAECVFHRIRDAIGPEDVP